MSFDLRELYSLDFEIKIADPIVNVFLVVILDAAKFVEATIHSAEE